MIVRRFREPDRAQVVALWNTVLPDSQPHNQPDVVLDKKLAVDDLIFVAEDDAPPSHSPAAGTNIVASTIAGWDGHRGWLYSVAVLPERQRQGIASTLVKAALAELRNLGCEKVNLQVRAGNEAVIAFYEALDFSVEARTSMGIKL
jgi:ribosomal protein S18 acetylase RimI-like enzyme